MERRSHFAKDFDISESFLILNWMTKPSIWNLVTVNSNLSTVFPIISENIESVPDGIAEY